MATKAAAALAAVILTAAPGAFAGSSAVNAGEPGGQPAFNSRLDQLAKPAGAPADDRPPTLDSPGQPSPGSFPRSFLIPGTDTSVRIGGFIDATGTGGSRP